MVSSVTQPIITSTLRIHDTCGVHNLHGMPAIISAIFSAIYASLATADKYKDSLAETFPAMVRRNITNVNGTVIMVSFCSVRDFTQDGVIRKGLFFVIAKDFGRTAQQQAGYQIIGVAVTVGIAIVTGLLTGWTY